MKKIILVLLIGLLAFTFVGCKSKNMEKSEEASSKKTEVNEENSDVMKFDEMGLSFNNPKAWANSKNIDAVVFGLPEEGDENPGIQFNFVSNETIKKFEEIKKSGKQPSREEIRKLLEEEKALLDINIYNKDLLKDKSIEELTKTKNNIVVGEIDNLVYYLSYPNKEDITGLSQVSQKTYDELYLGIETIKKSMKVYKPISPEEKMSAMNKFPEFETKDIHGVAISSDLFKENKLTMVNIWATFCGPCINEMPDLQKLYEEVKNENVNIVGIISDVEGNEDLAKEIILKTKVKYTNIIPDANIQNGLLKDVSGVPTSVFVNEKGEMVGEAIVGARSKEEYKKIIEEVLKNIQ